MSLSKPRRELAVLGEVIRLDRPIEMRARLRKIANHRLGNPNKSAPQHPRSCGILFLGQLEELRGEIRYRGCVKTIEVRHPKTVEHGKQQQRILRSLAACFGPFNQPLRAQCSRLGFGRAITAKVH
jgi:hypothetical protein